MLSKVDNEFQEEINTLCKEYGEENEPLFVELFNKMMINAFGNNKSEIYESMKNISMINFIPESTTLSLDNIKDYNGHEILSSRKEKVFEIFKNDTFSFFPELRKRKVVNKDIYDKINHISLNLSSIDDLIKNGWSIKQNFAQDFKIKNGNGITIGFLGNYLDGKTYYFNKIFNKNVELKPTETINYYFLDDKIRVIDIPGFNKPLYDKDFTKEKLLESKIKDFIVEKFVLDNSLILIVIIDSFNLDFQKKLEKFRNRLNENYNNQIVMKSIYIIHNNFKIKNDDEYDEYIETSFPESNYYNKDNIIYAEKLNLTDEKFEILHFVPKLYQKDDDKVMDRLHTHINYHIQEELLDFNDMVKNTFNKMGETIFNMQKSQLKVDKDSVKIVFDEEEKKEKEKEYENLEEEEKLFNQLKHFNKSVSWNNFRITSPHYSCFIDNNDNFIVQIELINYKTVKIDFKILQTIYIFHIVAKKNEFAQYKKMIQNTRTNDDVDFEFKIPIDTFTFKSYKYDSYTYEKGLATFLYKPLDIDNDNLHE